MVERQQRDLSQATATFDNTQAYILAISAEEISRAGLIMDYKRDSDNNQLWDTSAEMWNSAFPAQFDIGRPNPAVIKVMTRDLQGLFNLNWLHANSGKQAVYLARFQALLSELGLDTEIATNLKHWFTPGAGFNYDYQNEEPPYSASEIEMTHPSELLLVRGVTPEAYRKLEPFITALPSKSQLNINTTLPEVLSSWDAGLSLGDATTIVNKTRPGSCADKRSSAVYQTVNDLLSTAPIAELSDKTKSPNNEWDAADFDVKTQYFSVFSVVKIDERELLLEIILKRDASGSVITIYRDFSRTPGIEEQLVKNANCTG
jgi:general secretion pathway protein K